MGVAYSPPDRVIHAEIDASSSHCLRQGLHRAVQLAGWAVDRAVTNGYVYLLTSPQDPALQMKVTIQDTGRTIYPHFESGVIDIVFMDAEEENKSSSYVIRYGNNWSYGQPQRRVRADLTPCQIFTYVPGIAHFANSVAGGIPFLDPNTLESTVDGCADEENDLKTTRAWWSCGDLSTADYAWQVPSFRTSWHASCYAVLHNNSFVSEANRSIGDNTRLRMLPLNRPEWFWEAYGRNNFSFPVILRWMTTEEPLCFDPFIAWNNTHPVKIREQVWDAFVRTQYVEWESPLTFDALSWFSHSTGERQYQGSVPHVYSTGDLFTLYLRDPGLTMFECDEPEPEVPTESNYAY